MNTLEKTSNFKERWRNAAYLETPMKSDYDVQANALRDKILSLNDELPKSVNGTIWYISPSGKSSNSGKSPNDAWDSIATFNEHRDELKFGDAVLFERDGIYRGVFEASEGVYYGAYGKGDKPFICGSDRNYAEVNWINKGDNIWACEIPMLLDVGIIVFNLGEFMGWKKIEKSELQQNGDFWCDSKDNHTLYMYMDKNPSDAFQSIEIGLRRHIVTCKPIKNVTIENLCMKYTGCHGISLPCGCENITIRGCEIGFIGGSFQGGTVRFGNGIEVWNDGKNILMEYNWVYQIYDSGLTTQGGGKFIVQDVMMRKNLIEYCGMGSFEYFLSGNWKTTRGENITFTENICRFAGYNWAGKQRPDKISKHIRSEVACENTIFNFKITNNIFDRGIIDLVGIGGTSYSNPEITQETRPLLSGNVYAQNKDGKLGTYFSEKDTPFDENVEHFIKEVLGDRRAEISYY